MFWATSLTVEHNHSDCRTINFVLIVFFGACVCVNMCDLECLPALRFIYVFNCVYVYVNMCTHVYVGTCEGTEVPLELE